MNKKLIGISILIVLVIILLLFNLYSKHRYDWVSNFEECAAARFSIEDSSPARCVLPNGKFYVEERANKGGNVKSLPFKVLLSGTDMQNMHDLRPQENILSFFNDKESFNLFLTQNSIDLREQVDFVNYTVVVLFDVLQPTLGYSANLTDYQVLNTGKHTFGLKRLVPISECMQAQVVTRPFVVAVIDKTEVTEGQLNVQVEEYNPCK